MNLPTRFLPRSGDAAATPSALRPLLLTFLVAPLVLCAGPATAQTDDLPPRDRETFEDKQEVILVEVPVNVVDRAGNPIRGLQASDFRLWDEGDEQKIHGLEVVDLTTIDPKREELQTAVEQLPAVARRHFLFLFDLTFSSPISVVKAREAARRFVLRDLHPTDLAAVATFSIEQGPQLLVTYTPDRAQLARAIDTLGQPELLENGAFLDPLRFVIEAPTSISDAGDGLAGAGGGGGNLDQILQEQLNVIQMQRDRAQKAYERRRIGAWSRTMSEIARAMAMVEGRKHVVYFSEGFDGSLLFGRDASRPNADASRDQFLREQGALWMIDQDNTFGNSALQNDVNQMIETFRRSDCIIQAVDIAGLRPAGTTDGMSTNELAPRLNDSQDALFYVADATGGELFEDANDFGSQLEKVMERNSVTYVLSFYPSDLAFDGEFHKLKVKAALPRGARLSHRAGYYAPRAFEELHPLEKALLASQAIASATPREDIDIDLLAAPFRAGDSSAYVPVILEVDGTTLLAEHDGDSLGLEIYVYATDTRGEMRDFVTQILSLDLTNGRRETLAQSGVKYYGHLELPTDTYLLRVLVRNRETGKTAVTTRELRVPDWTRPLPEVLPPFFLEEPNRWLMVREEQRRDSASVIYPFIVNDRPFVPAAKPEIDEGGTADLCLVGYNLGEGDVALGVTIYGDDGLPYPNGTVELVERTETGVDELDKLLARFRPDGLRPGEYTLELSVRNGLGLEERSTIPFRVVG